MKKLIGIDLDNTIINYEKLFFQSAYQFAGVTQKQVSNFKKTELRDYIRNKNYCINDFVGFPCLNLDLPMFQDLEIDGDLMWQLLQLNCYGIKIKNAELMSGCKDFLNNLNPTYYKCCIISHKSEYAHIDHFNHFNLRTAAKEFLNSHQIPLNFQKIITEKDIYFCSTLEEKIQKISELDCDIFIDDLIEVFSREDFPVKTLKWHLAERKIDSSEQEIPQSYSQFKSWNDIHEYFRRTFE